MSHAAGHGPNAAQIDYWNAAAGDTWVELQDRLDSQIGPLGLQAMDALAPRAGETVLDIGCGCGQTSLELAQRVGPSGRVTGMDISHPMLEVARRRAAGTPSVSLVEADAQTHAFEPGGFDAAFSRFGVMFFADPAAAFANIRKALRPGGRLGFVCWRSMTENPWMAAPLQAAADFLPPQPPADPLAPGPYGLADPERIRAVLEKAGFIGLAIRPHDQKIGSGDLDQAVATSLRVGPLGAVLRENPDRRGAVVETLRRALETYLTPQGVMMDSATWIVRADTPA